MTTGRKQKRGMDLLQDPCRNRGTGFTAEERTSLKLEGLLPPAVETAEQRSGRVLWQLDQCATDLERYLVLMQLADNDEELFYHVVDADPARFLPIIYDPAVGRACQLWHRIFCRPRGMYVTIGQRGHIADVLRNAPQRDTRVICVSTGGRILGLGDLGADGMGIPVGKLQLYTACAGVPPQGLLPILLDCGTDNEALREDPLYLGLRRPRPGQEEMDAVVDEFVAAVQEVFPGCCLHFEDWKGTDAVRYLARYRERCCCYNDDIQGTAAVVLAGVISALRITGGALRDQRVLFLGAGSAGLGIAGMLAAAMEMEGCPSGEARGRIALMDVHGLLTASRTDLTPEQRVYARQDLPEGGLPEVVGAFQPTILIGVSTVGGAFTQETVEAMARLNRRPVIFALSNPTDHAECTAEQAYRWSCGRAVYAAGVQFSPVQLGKTTFVPGQANNFYIFPAVGLAVWAVRARLIPDEAFVEAAHAVAEQVTAERLAQGTLFPPQADILQVEVRAAVRVAGLLFDRGLAQVPRPRDIASWLQKQLYLP